MLALPSFLTPAALYTRVLNSLLQREDWARNRLHQHAGKTVRFVIGNRNVSLTIESSGFTQTSDPAIVPDVTLTIPARQIPALPGLIRRKDPSGLTAILHIEGDAALAQTVSDLARDLRWDVEHDLAALVGDVAAVRIMRTASAVGRTTQDAAQHLAENAGEYLAHESGLMANRQAFTVFTDTFGQMQRQLDQLEARAQALERAERHHV